MSPEILDPYEHVGFVVFRIRQVTSQGNDIFYAHPGRFKDRLNMFPNQVGLGLERFGHGLSVLLKTIQSADDEQACAGLDFNRMRITSVGRENARGIVLLHFGYGGVRGD